MGLRNLCPITDWFVQLNLDQALQYAVEEHQAGRLQEANKRYSAILKAQPNHPNANHNIGLLIAERGGFQRALPFF